MDGNCWSLWMLDRIISENKNYLPSLLIFADWLIDSHSYCLKCDGKETSSVYVDFLNGAESHEVARGLEEFSVYI